jgi:hypothetical protein
MLLLQEVLLLLLPGWKDMLLQLLHCAAPFGSEKA